MVLFWVKWRKITDGVNQLHMETAIKMEMDGLHIAVIKSWSKMTETVRVVHSICQQKA